MERRISCSKVPQEGFDRVVRIVGEPQRGMDMLHRRRKGWRANLHIETAFFGRIPGFISRPSAGVNN
jgi:hypothetical protein